MKLCFPIYRSTGNFRLCQLCDSWYLKVIWPGNQMVNTPQLAMSIATMEGEIVDVNV